jgi:hypothetical protein
MSPDPTGPPTIRHLDFSEFHPLDHWPAGPRCGSLPGGWRNHLSLAWTYRWSPQLAAETLCRIGRHRWCQGWHYGEPGTWCGNCAKPKPP